MELSSIETPRSPGQSARKKGSCGLQRNRQGLFRAKINLEAWSFFKRLLSLSFFFFRNFVKRLFDAFMYVVFSVVVVLVVVDDDDEYYYYYY